MARKRGLIVVTISLMIFGMMIYGGYIYVKSNLEKIIISGIRDYAKLNINFSKMTIGLNEEIILHNFKLYDKNTKEELIKAERFIVKYDMLRLMMGDRRINEFRVVNGSLDLKIHERFKKINIIQNFIDPNSKEYSTPIIEKITIQKSKLYYNDFSFEKPIIRELSNVDGKLDFNDKNRNMTLSAKGNIGKEIYGISIRTSMEENNFEIALDLQNIEINNEVMLYGYQNKDVSYKKGTLDLKLKVDEKMNLQGYAKIRNGILHYREVSRDIDKISGIISFEGRTKIKIKAAGYIDKEKADFRLEVKDYNDKSKTSVKINIDANDINYETLKYYENIRKNTELFKVRGILKKAAVEINIQPNLKMDLLGKVEAKEIGFFKETLNNVSGEFNFDAKLGQNKGLDENYKNIWTVKNVKAKFGDADITLDGTAESSKKYRFNINAVGIDIKKYVKEVESKTKVNINGKLDFTGIIEDENVSGDYTIKVSSPNIDLKEGNGKFKYYFLKGIANGNFNMEEGAIGNFTYDLKNYDLFLDMKINSPQKIRYLGFDGNVLGNVFIDANFKKNDIRSIRTTITGIDISTPKFGKTGPLSQGIKISKVLSELNIRGNKVSFDKAEIRINKTVFNFKGEADLESMKYNIKLDDTKININDLSMITDVFSDFNKNNKIELNVVVGLKAIINGDKDSVTCTADLNSLKGNADIELNKKKYNIVYNGIKTSFDLILKDKKIKVNGRSSLQNISFDENEIKEMSVRFSYDAEDVSKPGTIAIQEVKNSIFSGSGEYSLEDKRLNANFVLKNLEFDKYKIFKSYGIEGYIKEARGNVTGKISNPVIDAKIGDVQIKYGNIQILTSGELLVIDKVLNLKNFKIDDNIINGQLDLEKNRIDMKVNIFEPNFKKYLGSSFNKVNLLKDISGRIIGEINIWGDFESPRATATINLDQIYYNDIKVPDVFVKSTFNKKKLNISKIMCMGIEADGVVDIEKKDFEIKSKENEIDLKKIENFTTTTKLGGKIITAFNIIGNYGKLTTDYNLSFKSNKISVNEFTFNKLNGKIDGNLTDLNIRNLDALYENYIIKINGNTKLARLNDLSSWNMNIDAEKFDLKILQPFVKNIVENLKGTGSIVASIKKGNISGNISFEKAGLKLKNTDVVLDNISVSGKLEKDRVIINDVNGTVNKGSFSADGYFKLSLQTPEWKTNVVFNNVEYEYGKIFVKADGVISADEKKAEGKIIIDEGNISAIPEFKKSVKQIDVTNLNLQTTSGTNKVKKNIFENYNAKIGFEVKNKFELRLENIALIQNIQANIEGNGTVTYNNGKINLTGTLSTEKGALMLNNNLFKIDSAILVFDDPTQYLPNVNPSIAITAETSVASEYVYVSISGYLNNLQANFTSTSNLTPLEITRLLLLHTKEDTQIKVVSEEFFQSQIKNQIINPILDKFAKQWGFQKLSISTKNLFNTTKGQDILLGTSAEAAMYLYKDIVFLDMGLKYSDTIPGAFDSYNIGFKYNITDFSKTSLDYIFESFNVKFDTKGIENISLNFGTKQSAISEKEVKAQEGNLGIEVKFKY